MIFVIWSDYDHSAAVESFADVAKESAEKFVVDLLEKEDDNDYGTRLHAIIKGDRLGFKRVRVIQKVNLIMGDGSRVCP